MKRLLALSAAVVAGVALVRCATPAKSSKPGAQWFSQMHRLSAAHLRLMPVASSAKEFSDPKNKAVIESSLKDLAEGAQTLVRDEKAPDADPLIRYSALRFAAETKQAYRAFTMNDLQWAQYSLNRASGYCISCHTRADRGAKDFPMAWTPDLGGLTSPQKVEFLLANRRYASARAEATKLAQDIRAPQENPRDWLVAIERTLAMLIRVEKDPVEAGKLVQLVIDNRSAPFYFRSDAAEWMREIRRWRQEPVAKLKNRYAQAAAITRRTHGQGSANRTALVANLRASGLLHEELENSKSPHYPEALLYAGVLAQSLGDVNQGFVDQYYFEACIREVPHTELSEQCYDYLERSVRGANPFLDLSPEIEWYHLQELRKLAQIEQPVSEPAWKRRSWEFDLNEPPLDWQKDKRKGR